MLFLPGTCFNGDGRLRKKEKLKIRKRRALGPWAESTTAAVSSFELDISPTKKHDSITKSHSCSHYLRYSATAQPPHSRRQIAFPCRSTSLHPTSARAISCRFSTPSSPNPARTRMPLLLSTSYSSASPPLPRNSKHYYPQHPLH